MTTPLERSLVTVFRFDFTSVFSVAALPFGILPANSKVELVGTHLRASFGPWSISTSLANIEHAESTGPYQWFKVIGPPRLSFADQGLTFASNPDAGVCLRFREPVAGIEPFGLLRHPSLTVTVADPQALISALSESTSRIDELERDERAVLEARTAAELRALAREIGIPRTSSMKKVELIDLLLADEESTGEVLDRELTDGDGRS